MGKALVALIHQLAKANCIVSRSSGDGFSDPLIFREHMAGSASKQRVIEELQICK
jgi:hypothetical protein